MNKLSRADLYSLEQYAEIRPDFRAKVLAHKKNRKVPIGDHTTLYFEDRLTIQYQIQEMLRVERIFETAGIEDELNAYNPLIPEGTNLKATFMNEYPDVEQRRRALEKLIDIEDRVWMEVQGMDRVYAIADEDMERETEDKTSAVHFLRFEISAEMAAAIKSDSGFGFGIDHPEYNEANYPVEEEIRRSLAQDID